MTAMLNKLKAFADLADDDHASTCQWAVNRIEKLEAAIRKHQAEFPVIPLRGEHKLWQVLGIVSRCKESETIVSGEGWTGCILDALHDGLCQLRAKPDQVRAEQAGGES